MTLRPTRLRTLLAVGGLGAGSAYLLAMLFYRRLPELPRGGSLSLLLLGLGELVVATSVRARLAGRPGTRPILPLVVARYAVLAKASAGAAALAIGAWTAVAAYLALHRTAFPRTSGRDLVTAGLNVAAATVLLVAGLLLERACRVPGGDADPTPSAPVPGEEPAG